MSQQTTILLSGMIAGVPHQGGATWAVLQYLLGLRELGHEVFFVEPVSADVPLEQTESASYFLQVCQDFDLGECASMLLEGKHETFGLSYGRLADVAQRADLLINIAGMLTDSDLIADIPNRLYLDLDPGFTQLWHEAQGIDMRFEGHTHFATVGLAIGQPDCPVPLGGRTWITTPQPIVLRYWPVSGCLEHDAFTTVANWRGYGSIDHDGVFYGQKAHTIRQFLDLPQRTDEQISIALSIHADELRDICTLEENGWKWLNPASIASSPERYQRFIQGSKAELGFAKSGYVNSRCGWFSDRSVCYLASGRPVLAQETGFGQFLPTGHGLLKFETTDEILEGIAALRADYPLHAKKARSIAEEVFDSSLVLNTLLERVGVGG